MPEIPETNSQLETTGAAQTELRDARERRDLLSPDDLAMPTALSQAAPEVALPLADLAALGSGFSSVAAQVQAISTQAAATGSGTVLLAVTDSAGNALAPSVLNAAKDGSGLLGSYIGADGLAQARFHEVSTSALASGTSVVFNPSMVLMAVSVMAISRKLDKLQTSINELQRYFEIKDMAELRAGLSTLMSDVKKYPINCKDELFVRNAHVSAKATRRVAEKRIFQLQGLVGAERGSLRRLHTRGDVAKLADSISSHLQEYQLALQAYNYSSFAMIVLQGSFDEANLHSVRAELREHDQDYRELYTSCYDEIENASKSSTSEKLRGGLAGVAGGLSSLVAKTPVGDRTSIDEALADASVGLDLSNREKHQEVMDRLRTVKDTNVADYLESIDQLQAVNTNAVAYIADGETLYLVPMQEEGAGQEV